MTAQVIQFPPPQNQSALELLEYWLEMVKSGERLESLTIISIFAGETAIVDRVEAGQIIYGQRRSSPTK